VGGQTDRKTAASDTSIGRSFYKDRLLDDCVIDKDHLQLGSFIYETMDNDFEDELCQELDEDSLLFTVAQGEERRGF
jgi:hypothetical protein